MVGALRATLRWEEVIHSAESAKVHSFSQEYPRCWIVAADLEPGFDFEIHPAVLVAGWNGDAFLAWSTFPASGREVSLRHYGGASC
jgi:hypothetical protein